VERKVTSEVTLVREVNMVYGLATTIITGSLTLINLINISLRAKSSFSI
jgi:hypothetical protein